MKLRPLKPTRSKSLLIAVSFTAYMLAVWQFGPVAALATIVAIAIWRPININVHYHIDDDGGDGDEDERPIVPRDPARVDDAARFN